MLGRLLDHWELKVVALLMAVMLWTFVVGGERSRMVLTAPVEYVGLSEDAVIVSDAPERADVHLQVARSGGGRLGPESLRVRVDLSQAREGENLLALSGADVVAPAGVTVTRIVPSRLRLTIARAEEAELRVVPRVQGTPAPGFEPTRVVAVPQVVHVKGPRSTISGWSTVETAPVDISGSRATVVQTVGLVLPEFTYPTRGGAVQVTVEIRRASAR